MADTGDRTEKPTPKKLQDARKRGQVWRSRDLSSAVILVTAAAALSWGGPAMVGHLRGLTEAVFASALSPTPPSAHHVLEAGLATTVSCLWPLLSMVFLAAALVSVAQVRPLLTLEPLKPRLDRLDPVAGLKRLFSGRGLFDAAIASAKVLVVAVVVVWTVVAELRSLVALAMTTPEVAANAMAAVAGDVLWRGALVLLGLSILDVLYQRHRYLKDMRMTKHEVKREHREAEGDQSQKGERRRLHGELLEQTMLADVARADVVIVNPTHIAVALCYDEADEGDEAPVVVARGQNVLAQKIIEVARHHGVPVMRNVELARSLYDGVEVGDQIPEELYDAVAEILRVVLTDVDVEGL